MKESLKQVQETIQNIEGKKMSVGNNKKKSVDDVIEQLLGHSAQTRSVFPRRRRYREGGQNIVHLC